MMNIQPFKIVRKNEVGDVYIVLAYAGKTGEMTSDHYSKGEKHPKSHTEIYSSQFYLVKKQSDNTMDILSEGDLIRDFLFLEFVQEGTRK